MADPTPDTAENAGTPRWVKVSGTIVIVLVLLVVAMLLSGHGPGRHMPGGHLPPPSATEGTVGDHAPPRGWPGMIMTPRLRKFMLAAHVTSSVGLLGAVAGFLVLAIAGLISQDAQIVRAAYPAMDLIARFVIVPLAFAALLIGLVQSLGTKWGLFRHYWVLAKLVLTALDAIVLLPQMQLIGYMADVAADTTLSGSYLREARMTLVAHAGGGLLVLLVPMALSVYKPRGRTRYGWRKLQERRAPLVQ
ncbi:MAG TPA: hypothetical protein VNX29_23000 [Kaistia sp.]|nr:hypothetical protein [Kaistia sp.]